MQTEVISRGERLLAGWVVRRFWARDRSGGPWEPPEDLAWEPVSFMGNTGSRIMGRYFFLDDPRGVVVCVHPDRRYGGHWFVREGWVRFLLQAGFDVLTFDLTNYGRSRGPSTYYAEDVREAVRFARRWSGGQRMHVIGVSIGAYAAAIASPWLKEVESLILESPYPSFISWYSGGLPRLGARAFSALFPKTGRFLRADERIAHALPQRIVVSAAAADEVTPAALSRALAERAPPDRTRYVEIEGVPHLGLFADAGYRALVLETLGAAPERVAAAPAPMPREHGNGATVRSVLRAPQQVTAPSRR